MKYETISRKIPGGGTKSASSRKTNSPFAVFNPRWDDKPGVILGRPLATKLRVWKPQYRGEIDGEPVYDYFRVYLTTMVKEPGETISTVL